MPRFNIDHFLCSDGDDPFIDYKLGEILVDSLHNNCRFSGSQIPCGSLTYAVRAGGLAQILDIHNTEKSEMMWHFFENTSGLKIINHDFLLNEKYNIEDVESIRLTIDYDEDIRFARKLIQEADLMGNEISTEYICKLYSSSSSIFEINSFRQDQFLANQAANRDISRMIMSKVYETLFDLGLTSESTAEIFSEFTRDLPINVYRDSSSGVITLKTST